MLDVRVGSATDGRIAVSIVERSPSARAFHWVGLLSVAVAAFAADQLTKGIVVSQLPLGEGVHVAGPLWIRHVPNPGIAFGLFSTWAGAVTILTGFAVCWMLVYFARAGARLRAPDAMNAASSRFSAAMSPDSVPAIPIPSHGWSTVYQIL